jgi:hypothetical protein
MNQLAIKVRGEVLSSNFDEWKLELITDIRAVNSELQTEAQFAHAQINVKRFKVAEQALKEAKESAINQASDIQRLFAAIDEVSGEVRRVRLSLERQVKRRKLEIKEEFIERGMASIQAYIEAQDANFQITDYSDYLDRGAFEAAMKGRASMATLGNAVDNLCVLIKGQVDKRVALVRDNATKLDSLPTAHQALFQDRSTLLALSLSQLGEIIDQRIEVFERQVGISDEELHSDPVAREIEDQGPGMQAESGGEEPVHERQIKETFALTVGLLATRADANAFLREVQSSCANNPLVQQIRLEKT